MFNVSNNLRAGLRVFGLAKVSAQVMQDQQQYVGEAGTLADAAKSIAVKIAANRQNEHVITEGLASLRRSREI